MSDAFKFKPVEDTFSVGNPGEPGYTIITVFRGAYNAMRRNHTYVVTVTHFSGKVEKHHLTSVKDVRTILNGYSAHGTLNRPDIIYTGV